MPNEKKPSARRPIGPAMQWARDRSNSERQEQRRQQRINIELDIENDHQDLDLDYTSSRNLDNGASTLDTRPTLDQNRNDARTSGRSTAQYQRNQSSTGSNSDASSAWDYYSGRASDGQNVARQGDWNSHQQPNWNQPGNYSATGSNSGDSQPHFNDVGYEYPHQVETANYNARSTDLTSTTDSRPQKNPGIRQYLLPIIVAIVIIIVGFVGSQL